MVRNKKGVTLTSLSVYVVVSVVVLASLTFLNVNYMSQIAELSKKSENINDLLKVKSMMITDIKAAREIKQFSRDYLLLDNGVEYRIRYRANEAKETNQTYDIYELYRNDILVADKMTNLSFEYEQAYDDYLQSNVERWVIINMVDSDYEGGELYVRVGKGY